jgi:hypothetical protein
MVTGVDLREYLHVGEDSIQLADEIIQAFRAYADARKLGDVANVIVRYSHYSIPRSSVV